MHHKFVVIDFDKPTARVYLGSYNFSSPADSKNGENLLRIRDRRIAVSFMIEAVRICDHYDFRVSQSASKKAGKPFLLRSRRAHPARFRGGRRTTRTPTGSATGSSSPDRAARVR